MNILVTIASGSKQHESKACNEVYNEVYPQASSRIRQAKKGSHAAPEVIDGAASKVGGSGGVKRTGSLKLIQGS